MRPTYAHELDRLHSTFYAAANHHFDELREVLERASSRQALFIGAGGALAVAQFAADLHDHRAGMLSRAITPLEFVTRPPASLTAGVLFTASAKHSDALAVMKILDRGPYDPAVVVTHRPDQAKARLIDGSSTRVIEIPNELGGDGFLATNSVIAMVTALLRAHLPDQSFQSDLNRLPPVPPLDRRDWIVLTAPGLTTAAVDFETRLAELGVGTVQVVDYRNFAHGRHLGLFRRKEHVSVLALVAPSIARLAEKTIALLPNDVPVLRLQSELAWPECTIELLAQSIRVAAAISNAAGVNPQRPQVPEFGRRLYHLSLNGFVPRSKEGPVERKIAALGLGITKPVVRRRLGQSLTQWLGERADQALGGLVLDYDGTVCFTHERFEPLPRSHVRDELMRMLNLGLLIGFASGRGSSLHRDLRKWVPREFWSRVLLGLYNGGLELSLEDDPPTPKEPTAPLEDVCERLHQSILGEELTLELRPYQLTVSASAPMRDGALATIVREALERPPHHQLKITTSAHSVDIIPAESTKVQVLRTLERRTDLDVLTIGDQGQLGGNDFELLASTEASLSVDRCSGDPTRCWNLGQGPRGPQLLVEYLTAITGPDQPRFVWPQ
jgi:hypothetical protein